jgi:hypothetical protein
MEVIWRLFIFERCVAQMRLTDDGAAWRAFWTGLTVAKVRLACDGGALTDGGGGALAGWLRASLVLVLVLVLVLREAARGTVER